MGSRELDKRAPACAQPDSVTVSLASLSFEKDRHKLP